MTAREVDALAQVAKAPNVTKEGAEAILAVARDADERQRFDERKAGREARRREERALGLRHG